MIIKNLTKQTQILWIRNLLTGDVAAVQVLPSEPRELSKSFIPDKSKMKDFDKLFEIVGRQKKSIPTPITMTEETSPAVEETFNESQTEEIEEESTSEATTLEDRFICDICGEEFASARGLASHKNRSHKE